MKMATVTKRRIASSRPISCLRMKEREKALMSSTATINTEITAITLLIFSEAKRPLYMLPIPAPTKRENSRIARDSTGFGYLLRCKKQQPVMRESVEQVKQRLIVELAQLDDDFASRRIDEKTYLKQRSVAKARLIELMMQSK